MKFIFKIAIRKTLHNYVEDMKGKIRVYCRVRPMLPSEIERNHKTIVQKKDEFTMNVETKQGIKTYKFDSIFDEKSSQVSLNSQSFYIFFLGRNF